MPKTRQQRVGRWGEETAAHFLERKGYTILDRNIHTPYGEIDLICRQPGGLLVFVEVKTRTSLNFGFPEEAVDARKLGHMVSASKAYIDLQPEPVEMDWRIDVIAVQGKPGEKDEDVLIEHFEDVAA